MYLLSQKKKYWHPTLVLFIRLYFLWWQICCEARVWQLGRSATLCVRHRDREGEQTMVMMSEMMAHWPTNAAVLLPVGMSWPTAVHPVWNVHTQRMECIMCCLFGFIFFPLCPLTPSPFPHSCVTSRFISCCLHTCSACYDSTKKQRHCLQKHWYNDRPRSLKEDLQASKQNLFSLYFASKAVRLEIIPQAF